MNQDIFSADKTFSLEVFPPKKDDDFASAFSVLDEMGALSPDFISVTYGAGGSRAGKTIEIASYIENTLHIPAIAHVTCVGSTKESVSQVFVFVALLLLVLPLLFTFQKFVVLVRLAPRSQKFVADSHL